MRFFELAAPALLAVTASAKLSFWPSSAAVDDSPAVPGESPLKHCGDPTDDILTIHSVNIDPNPPIPGHPLLVTANGTLKEDIEAGAMAKLQVKYGMITIVNQEVDLCETAENVNMSCPLEKGEISLSRSFNLIKAIPPGTYEVVADVFTKDEDEITCLTAMVEFKRGATAAFKEDM